MPHNSDSSSTLVFACHLRVYELLQNEENRVYTRILIFFDIRVRLNRKFWILLWPNETIDRDRLTLKAFTIYFLIDIPQLQFLQIWKIYFFINFSGLFANSMRLRLNCTSVVSNCIWLNLATWVFDVFLIYARHVVTRRLLSTSGKLGYNNRASSSLPLSV